MDINQITHVSFAGSTKDKLDICDDLGYKPSDLLQANCVIWVEGPSDRLYLNYWLHAKSPDLIEGVDYSIMFYGGRLLSCLSGEDQSEKIDIEKLINLFCINQRSFVLMDSDKKSENDTINKTKQRIVDEFPDSCWITKGREIENYLPTTDFISVYKDYCKKEPVDVGSYSNRLKDKELSINKVDFAKEFIERNASANFTELDLDDRISSLVNYIKKVNE